MPPTPVTPPEIRARAWAFIASQEGSALSLDPEDPGNFTPDGRLVGSRWGISAHSFPTIDIAAMTYEHAQEIFELHFWAPIRGDELVGIGLPGLAILLADSCFMSGPSPAVVALQSAIGLRTDGIFGPQTMRTLLASLNEKPLWTLPTAHHCLYAEYAAERIEFEAGLANWKHDKNGWISRMMRCLALATTTLPTQGP